MTPWMLCSAVLVASLAPCGIAVFRGDPFDRLAALQMAEIVLTLTILTLCEAVHRTAFVDLAVALSLLALGGSLVFVRLFERWL
jgi:multisubunit Na+/H+ antiporter MnhF subunit